MQPRAWIFYVSHRAIVWSHSKAIGADSGVFASMIVGESVSTGIPAMHLTWKSLIIIEETHHDYKPHASDSSRRNPARGVHGSAGIVGQRVGAGAAGDRRAHQ